jgi:hypothetical protein
MCRGRRLGRGTGARRSRRLPLAATHRRTGLQITFGRAASAALECLRQNGGSCEERDK